MAMLLFCGFMKEHGWPLPGFLKLINCLEDGLVQTLACRYKCQQEAFNGQLTMQDQSARVAAQVAAAYCRQVLSFQAFVNFIFSGLLRIGFRFSPTSCERRVDDPRGNGRGIHRLGSLHRPTRAYDPPPRCAFPPQGGA